MSIWVLNLSNEQYEKHIVKEDITNPFFKYLIIRNEVTPDSCIVRLEIDVYSLSSTKQVVKEFLGLDLRLGPVAVPLSNRLIIDLDGKSFQSISWEPNVYDSCLYQLNGIGSLREHLKRMLYVLTNTDKRMFIKLVEDSRSDKKTNINDYGFGICGRSLIEVISSYPKRQYEELLDIAHTFLTAQIALDQF